MQTNPREKIEKMVKESDLKGLLNKAVEFHGHYCHKVAYGVKASVLAINELDIESMEGERGRVVGIVDSPGPFCNGIQFTAGLTIADSSLVIRELGKLAFTLLRSDGSAVRVSLRPEFLDNFPKRNPEVATLFGAKYGTICVSEEEMTPLTIMRLMGYIREKMGVKTEEEMKKMMEQMMGTVKAVVLKELEISDEDMFKVEKKRLDFSQYAPICQCTNPMVVCESCGETVLEPYIRTKRGKNICVECAGEEYDVLLRGKIVRATLRI